MNTYAQELRATTQAMVAPGKGMLLMAVASQNSEVDWYQWQTKAKELAKLVDLL